MTRLEKIDKNFMVSDDEPLFQSQLPIQQQQAIMLLVSAASLKEVAAKLGVTDRTISRWLTIPEFQAELQMVQNGIINQVATRLIALQDNSLTKLNWLLENSQDEKIQLQAAIAIQEYFIKWFELVKVNRKLDEIEELLTSDS